MMSSMYMYQEIYWSLWTVSPESCSERHNIRRGRVHPARVHMFPESTCFPGHKIPGEESYLLYLRDSWYRQIVEKLHVGEIDKKFTLINAEDEQPVACCEVENGHDVPCRVSYLDSSIVISIEIIHFFAENVLESLVNVILVESNWLLWAPD